SIWLAVPVLLGFNLNQMYTLNIGVMPLVYVSGRNRYIGEYYLNTPMQNNYHILWNYLKAPVVFGMGAFCFNLRLLGKIGDKSWFFLNAECGKMYNFKYDLPSVFMYRASVGISYCVSFKK
ncbi:MAG TPA: hypothetical protein PLM49_00940, partial [Bacteroidales bacterium]|nr:hypothetical protein [Bacteroidales bacterium]